MLRVVLRVRYGRLPGDIGMRLRGLGPPFSQAFVSGATLCNIASIAFIKSLFWWYDSSYSSSSSSERPGITLSFRLNSFVDLARSPHET